MGSRRVDDHTPAGEGFELANAGYQALPRLVAANEAPVDDAGSAMVVSEALTPDAGVSHGAVNCAPMNSFLARGNLGEADLSPQILWGS
jgi:hypothetical protein